MAHLSDLDIANQSELKPIGEIAEKFGIPDALEQYGHYKAKIDINQIKPKDNKGKVVLVTAMSPTPKQVKVNLQLLLDYLMRSTN